MKKIFIGLFSMMLFIGCQPADRNTVVNESGYKSTVYISKMDFGNNHIDIYKYKHNGHLYQYHIIPYGNASTAGVIHDPDCPCHKNITSDMSNE